MLVDANILLYSVDTHSRHHRPAREWLEGSLNGTRRVGIPWMSLVAFVRIATNPRATSTPMQPADAWAMVESWLTARSTWVPEPGPSHAEILGRLVVDLELRANLIPDAVLAALCIEHGLTMVSADTDFARFTDIRWLDPTRRSPAPPR